MKVLKFGGTSLGSSQRMKNVAQLIREGEKKIVVLSAMSGTTNTLIDIAACFYQKDKESAYEIIGKHEQRYAIEIDQLFSTSLYKEKAQAEITNCFHHIWSFSEGPFTHFEEKDIVAQGEIMSCCMMNYYLQECGVHSVLLPALDFMRTTVDAEPDLDYISEKLTSLLNQNKDAEIYITQGFICRNAFGQVDNLKRGGSDYTASLIGAALHSEEIQIWTDIDGMHNNDPRFVNGTSPVRQLNFEEAAKLAYFGAKILHPTCILPAKTHNIPVRLLNTLDPAAPGTLISNTAEKGKIKAVAAKDGITYVKIKSERSLVLHKFLSKVFETFASYQTPVDMVTTSEIGVSVTIDDKTHLPEIIKELQPYASVTLEEDMVIICVVGDLEWQNIGFEASIINSLKDIPVRMISYGGSNSNVSLVMKAADKKRALQALSESLFG
ncbi:aspartate kinase [Parabacteroides pacaensis]|uniref:aspartate kinase n=1 Tax=Parabacteroides pacaensis TaxID=2086575 RepID=UPI000D0F35E5|nr:aspartate kinase [Parabacteroides pacaensis]